MPGRPFEGFNDNNKDRRAVELEGERERDSS